MPMATVAPITSTSPTNNHIMEAQNIFGNIVYYSKGNAQIELDSQSNFTGAIIGPAIIGRSDYTITYDTDLGDWPGPNPSISSCNP